MILSFLSKSKHIFIAVFNKTFHNLILSVFLKVYKGLALSIFEFCYETWHSRLQKNVKILANVHQRAMVI